MSDASDAAKSLRDRLGGHTEDRLGRALSDLLDNPLLTGAIGRAFDAREKAAQAQEVALGALNLPSAADIERLTRRLRSVTHRLEAIEEGVERLDDSLSARGVDARLAAIERQLQVLIERLEELRASEARSPRAEAAEPAGRQRKAAAAKGARKAKAKSAPRAA